MALTEPQKIKVRKLLGIYREMRFSGYLNPYDYLEQAFDALSDDQVEEVETILAQYAKVEFSTGVLSGDFTDDPANRRALLKEQIGIAINFNPKDYGVGGFGLQIGRA